LTKQTSAPAFTLDDWKSLCNQGHAIVELTYESSPTDTLRRTVTLGDGSSDEVNELVWPIWVPQVESDSSASDFKKTWDDAASQSRTTAKWIASILGAALAALIGTAPLSGVRNEYIPWDAYLCAGIGLGLIVLTIYLVIRVLVPQVTLFTDLVISDDFDDLRSRIQGGSGILLPIGIHTLAELGGRAQVEALTLNALAFEATDHALQLSVDFAKAARDGRAKWLNYLNQNIAQWTTVATYEEVRKRVGVARIWGLIAGAIGTASIILAFLLPAQGQGLATYKILPNDNTAKAEQLLIGKNCATFKGVIVDTSGSNSTMLVERDSNCAPETIELPGADLAPVP
jgi:hypothetical protein